MNVWRVVLRAVPLTAGISVYGGCYLPQPERDPRPSTAPRTTAPRTTGLWDPMALLSGSETLQGDMGLIRGFASESAELRVAPGTGTRPVSQVQLDAVNEPARWWVMTRLTFVGGLSHPSLQPGATLSFSRPTAGVPMPPTAPDALRVTLLGCSGPRRNNYTFDRSADRVDLSVLPGSTPESRRVEFTATWNSPSQPPQVVRGAFEYDPQ